MNPNIHLSTPQYYQTLKCCFKAEKKQQQTNQKNVPHNHDSACTFKVCKLMLRHPAIAYT